MELTNTTREEWTPELRQKIIDSRFRGNHTIAQLGIKCVDLEPGYAAGEMEIKDIHINPLGSVHGGMIFTFADSIGGTAACSRGSWIVTSSSSMNFFRPAFHVKKLYAYARELKAGNNLLTYEVEIRNEQDILIAKSTIEYCSLHVAFGHYDLLEEKQKDLT